MQRNIKQKVNKLVIWSVRNHWLFLVVIVGLQYVTGKMMVGDIEFSFNDQALAKLHSFLGVLIFVFALVLSLDKLYLWLLKRGKL